MHPEPKNDTEADLVLETPSKKGGREKKMKATEVEKERGELSPVPLAFPCVLYFAPVPTI